MNRAVNNPWLARHWLAVASSVAWSFALLPVLAPVLMAAGLDGAADTIYSAYTLVCHQWAHRSFFLFGPAPTYSLEQLAGMTGGLDNLTYTGSSVQGFKIAFCERDLAIYLTIAAAGSVYALHRGSVAALSVRFFVLMLVPIAIDGFTQLFGWRESTPFLRLITGACFGGGTVWFIYPRLDAILGQRSTRPAVAWMHAPS
jgi:uncharacterized membrane protein